jgi:hypothetical protein
MSFYERWVAEAESTPQKVERERNVPVPVNSNASHQEVDLSGLPAGCPLSIGGRVPNGCRFEPKFFNRMIHEGSLSYGGPCPLSHVCRMRGKQN